VVAGGAAAGAALFGTVLSASTVATIATVSSAAITIAGSAAIAAGISATAYSSTHTNGDFSWKDYWIQAGISGAVGAVTGGLLMGLSAVASGITSSFWSASLNIVGSGLIASAGDVTGQFFTNLAEGARGHDLANGLLVSAISGFVFGAAGAVAGYAMDKGARYVATRFTKWRFTGEMEGEAQRLWDTRTNELLVNGKNEQGLSSFPRPIDEKVSFLQEQKVGDLLSKPIVRAAQLAVTSSPEFPEFYVESRDWKIWGGN